MPDFGTTLPFNRRSELTRDCWQACYFQVNPTTTAFNFSAHDSEWWVYFAWLPGAVSPFSFLNPYEWAVIDVVPHEHLFTLIRNEPVHFLGFRGIHIALLCDLVLSHGSSYPEQLGLPLESLRRKYMPKRVDWAFERFLAFAARLQPPSASSASER